MIQEKRTIITIKVCICLHSRMARIFTKVDLKLSNSGRSGCPRVPFMHNSVMKSFESGFGC